MPKITKDTTLSEILSNPEAERILAKYNVPCLSCPFAQYETKELKIGDVCKMYKINLKTLLTELSQTKARSKRNKPSLSTELSQSEACS